MAYAFQVTFIPRKVPLPGYPSGLEIRDQTFDTYCASGSNWDIFKDKGHFHISIANENVLKGQFKRFGSV